MKKIYLMVALMAAMLVQKTFAQTTDVTGLQLVISSYLSVKNALTKDNGAEVRAAAKTLFEAIQNVPMDKLVVSQHKVWMEYNAKLSYDAEHIKGTDELEHQREHFSKLSLNFYKMLQTLNANSMDLYYQFCPMANDGKGAYWVSENEAITNPYMGRKMLKCGSTKETLQAKE